MIKIVPFSKKYKDEVVHLILDIYENELGFTGYNRPDIYNIFEIYQENGNSNFWLALSDKELVGTIGVLEKTKKVAYLKRMVVKKEFRNQGIGQKLLQVAIEFTRKHGFQKIYAGTVLENMNAIEFYQKQGFVQGKVVPEEITASSDAICFELNL